MENSNKNETIIIIVFTVILLAIIGIIVYTAYTSTNSLENNIQSNENIGQNNTSSNTTQKTDTVVPDKSTEPTVPSTPIPVETQIAIFSSNIYDHDLNRVFNIELAIKKINGVVIKKGEIFSFNDTVGPMGEEQGFKEAIGFDTNGKNIKIFGGGMCQISSTIYNSALIANLEIIERHPHSKRVYYVPKDKDATIYYGSLDLKFKNTTDNDIKIVATSDNSNVTIILNKITSGI
ncbi:MAG: VanW family protein [Clostridia bacterium]|nr:VanW family protein [Clostridia bacterium]MDD4387095.1 VanW family protein [Clostridia bacterium]